jgi:hypothetical protein
VPTAVDEREKTIRAKSGAGPFLKSRTKEKLQNDFALEFFF